jgi:putative ABC transport system permease protein
MRLYLAYLLCNLTRNLPWTVLICTGIAAPLAIFVWSVGVVQGIDNILDNSAKQLRLAITHKASLANLLPAGHREKIEALDASRARIRSVCGIRWLGGRIENDPRPLSTLAADPDTVLTTFPEYFETAEGREAWLRDRQAIVVGRATAAHFHWKIGDRVTLEPSVPPYTRLEFHIVAITDEAANLITSLCRRDFVDQELKKIGAPEGWVSFFFVKCSSSSDLEHFRVLIDDTFARSLDETKTQDEKTFMTQFVTQQFDLPRRLSILAAVTVVVAILAAASTMSMNYRDRNVEFATLKSIGFPHWSLFLLLVTESMTMCLVGGILGAFVPYAAFNIERFRDALAPLIRNVHINPWVCVHAVIIGPAIGLAAAIWPAWTAWRTSAVALLRSLE